MGHFTFWRRPWLSLLAEPKTTLTGDEPKSKVDFFSFGLSHGSVRTFGSAEAEPFGSDQSSD